MPYGEARSGGCVGGRMNCRRTAARLHYPWNSPANSWVQTDSLPEEPTLELEYAEHYREYRRNVAPEDCGRARGMPRPSVVA